jgi:cobalt-zinc-cadmium efflux system protein
MGHGHHHHHHHDHAHDEGGSSGPAQRRRMMIALGLTSLYMVAEVIGGLVSDSLALLADAGHMLSDAAALALSLFAMWMASRPASKHRTYGYHRSEVLAALVNGAALLAIAAMVVKEAYERLGHAAEVRPVPMLLVATGGLAMNLVVLASLRHGKDSSLNMRAAFLHVASDALGSVGAIAAGLAIWLRGWYWADPVASVIIALLVTHSAWSLLRETVGVLMEHAPTSVDVDELQRTLTADEEVHEVHDLHVWTITSGLVCLSAHVVVARDASDQERTLARLTHLAKERYGIDHITIQLERPAFRGCASCR